MKIDCNVDLSKFTSRLDEIGKKQIPFAAAKALNRTARRATDALKSSMKQNFSQPTAWTLNSTFIVPATMATLEATVKLKDNSSGLKAAPPSVYLAPQVFGGVRQAKRGELMLQRKGILATGSYYVPGPDAKLDSYGNMSRGQLSQLFSAVMGFGEQGFLANKSFRRGARMNKTTNDIFLVPKKMGSLEPGIYMRAPNRQVKCLLRFVTHAGYSVRLPFDEVVSTVYLTDFADEFNIALRNALDSGKVTPTPF